MEKEDAVGEDIYGTENRFLDSRIGKWWSTDPVVHAWQTPYNSMHNNPISFTDPRGDCPTCPDGTYKIQKGDTFWDLENKWNMQRGDLEFYNPDVDPKKLSIGQRIKVSPTESFEFITGISIPSIGHDNGFGDLPKQKPELSDYWNYIKWAGATTPLSQVFYPSLSDGLKAYRHYLHGDGSDRIFSLERFMDEDPSGQQMKRSALNGIIYASEILLPYEGTRHISMSNPFAVGDEDERFPYPETENWQKTIGGFSFYMLGVVSAKMVEGKLQYKLSYLIHAEDVYNFNPGGKDKETSRKDEENGRFRIIGWGKQYKHHGNYYGTTTW